MQNVISDYRKPFFFYLPTEEWPPEGLPTDPDVYWHNFRGKLQSGVYAWTIQTCLRLQRAGVLCEITGQMPPEGIVIVHRDFLTDEMKPGPGTLLVCCKVDRSMHFYSQIHVVLNPKDCYLHKMLLPGMLPGHICYIPHWPQPGLIPREPSRGSEFSNVGYIGDPEQIADELKEPAWARTLEKMGLRWHLVDKDQRHKWNNFSYLDAIVAIRKFTTKPGFQRKPALKLWNAWHAGVPAILSCEFAYRQERKSDLDFIEVTSMAEAIDALKRLQQDPGLRQAMIANGLKRAEETKPEKILQVWLDFLRQVAVPEYIKWTTASPGKRALFLNRRKTGDALFRILYRFSGKR